MRKSDMALRSGIFLLMIFLLSSVVSAQVVVFDRYHTTAVIGKDTITIERDVRLRNVGKTPIIPGELHFRLYERRGDEKVPIAVTDFTAASGRGESLGTTVSERSSETDLSVQIWNPLLPGFSYEFSMQYTMDFDPSGVLFYEITLPREETTIAIQNEETSFVLEDGYHVTYAPGGEIGTLSGNTVVNWEGSESSRVVEYSRLPLPKLGIRVVNVFWIFIITILIGLFAISVLRKRMNSGGNSRPPQQQYQYQPYQQHQQQYRGPQQGPPGGWG